jgi:hypothetical protein
MHFVNRAGVQSVPSEELRHRRPAAMPRGVDPRPQAESESEGILTGVTAIVGICASIVAIPLIVAFPGHWPALAGGLLIACVPPGAAVMCWVDSGFGVVQAGLTLVLSLSLTAIAGAMMIWLTEWHPKALFALAFASALSCAVRLRRRGLPAWPWTGPVQWEGLWTRLVPLVIGLALWAYGVSKIQRDSVGSYGLFASANIWFVLGFMVLLGGGLLELLRSAPRAWLLCAYLVTLIVMIHATVPILYGVPEYGWVYKHIGVIQMFEHYGRVINTSDIYQEWPAFFAAVASVSAVAKVGPLSFAAWGPLAFELTDALLLLGIFRMLAVNRRAAYLAVFLYEGVIAWVGQDYLSPQAFAYLLWLGMAAIIIRWLLMPGLRNDGHRGIVSRLRGRLLAGLPVPESASQVDRRLAWTMVFVVYFAIVAAHQLTPYLALLGVGGLVALGLLWRGWLFLAILCIIAIGFLAPRYGLLSQFGGLFSGLFSSTLANASGKGVAASGAAERFTAEFVHFLAAAMWLLALAAVVRNWRNLGRVAIPAVLAFTPFLMVIVQSYGGEAIYRVYMFSAPWCAILIADTLMEMRAPAWRRLLATCACTAALAAGIEGDYGLVGADTFMPQELAASLWLYNHAPPGSALVLAADNFPVREVYDYQSFNDEVMPSDPTEGLAWLNEADVPAVDQWLASLGTSNVYVVTSRSMKAYELYFGIPNGYPQMVTAVAHAPGWAVAYRNSDVTIYRVATG